MPILPYITTLRRATGNRCHAALHELEHTLRPWVVFAIMPLFALANAGVPLGGGILAAFTNPVSLGVVVGLILGKQLGVALFAWLAVKSGLSELPGGVGWRPVYGVGWLAGIGFTMSLLITDLAFTGKAHWWTLPGSVSW